MRGRLPRRRAAIAVGAALAVAAATAAARPNGGEPDAAPAAESSTATAGLAGAAGSVAPRTAPVGLFAAPERTSAFLAGHARRVSMNELTGALAAARQGGGSPVAVVTSRTALRAAPGGRVVKRLGTETEFGSQRVHAVVSRQGGWLEVLAAELPNRRTGWITAEDVEVGGVELSLRASLAERTLEVRRAGRVVRRVRIGVGGPATPTPTGTFAVTDKLRTGDAGSPYGCCVLAFTGHQPHVPQGWSGGDRLAIHATPDEETVGKAVTLGCFRADDADMRWLMDRIPLGAPVTVAP